jgi:putative ABC transport system permease protein
MRWTDSRNAAPGIEMLRRPDRQLPCPRRPCRAGGGRVGISAAIRSYLDGKTETIATLKTLGAEGGLIFRIYLWQTALLSILGHRDRGGAGRVGPASGRAADRGLAALPRRIRLAPMALVEAAFYGALSALIFTLSAAGPDRTHPPGRALSRRGRHARAGRAGPTSPRWSSWRFC